MYELALGASNHIRSNIYLGKTPRISLTLLLFFGKILHYFNTGANKIYVYDGKNELILTKDIKAAFTTGEFKLFPEDIVAIFSVGLHVNLIARERMRVFNSRMGINDKALSIVNTVARKDIVNQNNATALLVEVAR